MKDYSKELIRLKETKILKKFKSRCKIDKILSLVNNSFLEDLCKKAFIKLITKRYKEFLNIYENISI